jgi:hypothetical protein
MVRISEIFSCWWRCLRSLCLHFGEHIRAIF